MADLQSDTTGSMLTSPAGAKTAKALLELQAILENATVGILFTRNRILSHSNPQCAEMFGYTPEEFIGLPGRAIYPSDEAYERVGAMVGPVLAAGGAYRGEIDLLRKDGSTFLCRLSAKAVNPLKPNDGTIWIMEDVTEDHAIQNALRQSTAELTTIFESALIGIAVVRHGRIHRSNHRFEELLALPYGLVSGASVRDLFASDEEFLASREEFRAELSSGGTHRHVLRLKKHDGSTFWARISGRAFDPTNIEGGSVWLLEDITEQQEASARLEQALEEQNMIFENAAVGIMFLRNRVLLRCNSKLAEICGYTEDYLQGKSTRIFYFSDEDYLEHARQFTEVIRSGGVFVRELKIRHAEGHPVWVRASGRSVENKEISPEDADIVWIVEDITEKAHAHEALNQAHALLEQRVEERTAELASANEQLQEEIFERMRAEQRIWHVAHHDALTGLPNRVLLHDRLEQLIGKAERDGKRVAVLFVDLDRFKNINDSLGHHIGDEFLKHVAQRLQTVVRSVDTVSRLGGDEFVIVLPDLVSSEDAATVAAKVVDALAPVANIQGHALRSTPSIGISVYPDDGTDPYGLMKNADTAMYHAKAEGRNNYQFFTLGMNEEAVKAFSLEQKLRTALSSEQFVLHYQPVIHHMTRAVGSFEALVRWNDPGSGLVPPGDFIPIAEDTGLIIPIGEWALSEAMRQNRVWQEQGLPLLPIAVNLSPRQFRHAGLVSSVRNALRESGQPAHLLELEITESALMHDVEEAREKLNELSAMGVHIAIDDFGTGYSSLSHLKHFPVNKLKVDQSFVRDICDDKDDETIVAAIIGLARSLGLDTVAEGVETAEQLDLLIDLHCSRFQGYLFSPPVPASKVPGLVMPDLMT